MITKESFDAQEKAETFDKLFDMYFQQNFGSTTKSDVETFLFSAFIEHCLNHGNQIDDYTLSKQLGITQSRIRSLKERKELKYPRGERFKWQEAFAESIKTAKYDEDNHRVKTIIQDVNVLIEIRHYIEISNWYDEPTLNRKMLQVPLDCFIEICASLDNDIDFDKETEKVIRGLKSKEGVYPQIKNLINDYSKEALLEFLKSSTKEGLRTLLPLLPFGNIGKTAIEFFLKILE